MIYYNKNKTQKFQNSGRFPKDNISTNQPIIKTLNRDRLNYQNEHGANALWLPVGIGPGHQIISQDDRTNTVRDRDVQNAIKFNESNATLQKPLIYLEDPFKILGDLGLEWAPNSAEDVERVRRAKAGLSSETLWDIAKEKVPAAAFSTALAVAGGGNAGTMLNNAFNPVAGIDNLLTNKIGVYKLNPYAWKPDPNKYYRAGHGRSFLDDAIETGKVRSIPDPNKKISFLDKVYAEADTYFSRGKPLDGTKGSLYYGDHIIEVPGDIPFVHVVNQRTKQKGFIQNPDINYNSTHTEGMYVKPRQSFEWVNGRLKQGAGTPLDLAPDFKLLKPHWWKRYKEIEKPFSKGGILYRK